MANLWLWLNTPSSLTSKWDTIQAHPPPWSQHTYTLYVTLLCNKTRFHRTELETALKIILESVSSHTTDTERRLKRYRFSSLFLVLTVRDLFGHDIISKHCNAGKLATPHLLRLQIELKLLSRQAKAWRTVFDSYFIGRPWIWRKSVHGQRMKVSIESLIPHLTLSGCVRNMCFPLHFLLMENDMKSVVGGATPWRGPLLCMSVTKLQLSWWRGEGRHLRQSLITKTARSQERERKPKVMERAEKERIWVGRCSGN